MTLSKTHSISVCGLVGSRAGIAALMLVTACGIRSPLLEPGAEGIGRGAGGRTGTGGDGRIGTGGSATGGRPSTGGSGGTAGSRGGSAGATIATGGVGGGPRGGSAGSTAASGGVGGGPRGGSAGATIANGGSGGNPRGGSGGGPPGPGGTAGNRGGNGGGTNRDASPDSLGNTDALAPGVPAINPNSGYVTLATGAVVMSGYVSSYSGGSGSTMSLSYDSNSFCLSGTVGASATYNSWAGAGFNVNQAQSGSSGSTGQLVLVGSTIAVSYINKGGSTLELQLWDGSNYWCYYLPPSTTSNTVTVPFSSLNTQCWNNAGTTFKSGTPITTVQLDVPGSASVPTPFDFCFLGLTVQ